MSVRAAALVPVCAVASVLGAPGGLHAQAAAPGSGVEVAEAALRTGRYDEAIAGFRDLVRRGEAFPRADRGLVRSLARVGRYEESAEAARAAADARPGSPAMGRALGEALERLGRLEEAERAFRTAVEGEASDAPAAEAGLARLAERRGDREAAMAGWGRIAARWEGERAAGRRARGGQGAGALDADGLTAAGEALARLGLRDPARFRDAVRAFEEAIAADPGDPEPRVRLGDLFLEKYNSRDAGGSFQEVLRQDPRHPGALLGMARRARFDGSPEAFDLVRRSLDTNPASVEARVLLARLHLDVEDAVAAGAEARKALETDPRSLEALSALAAARYLADDRPGFEEARDRALALHPGYAGVHLTAGELAVRNRRYADAVSLARQALELDPESHEARALLGLNLLRTGEPGEARRVLEAAFEADPFNVWVKNTLDLLDTFPRFREVRSGRFVFLVREEEAAALGPYLSAVAEEAFDALAARYGYEPPVPIRVEVYDRHADFSVRTVGLAGLGALGVSFGSVLAMDSPSAREIGEFAWASTLWHEISHAFTLGATAHRIPRWLSEGLAVHDERLARPAWGMDPSPDFLAAYREGRLESVGSLNRGFVRPSYPGQVAHSYLQASLVCAMIEEEMGREAILGLLRAHEEGLGTEEAFRRVLGTDPESFDRRFRTWLDSRFEGPLAALGRHASGGRRTGGARTGATETEAGETRAGKAGAAGREPDPGDYAGQLARGRALLEAGRGGDALPYFERARSLFPQYAGPGSPYRYLARIHAEAGRPERAAAELAAWTARDETAYHANLELARLLAAAGDRRGAAGALERALHVYPLEPEPHVRLAELYEALGEAEAAVGERAAVVALDPADRAGALYRLALAQERAGDREAALRTVVRALETAPGYEDAQTLLLRLRGLSGEPEGGREP